MNKQEDFETISTYTSNNAEEDGILVRTSTLLPEASGYAPHLVSHITTNLLTTQQYFERVGDRVDYRRANIVDLLNQAGPKIRDATTNDPAEYFVSMNLEGPRGNTYNAFAVMNEYRRWTLMLPDDY